MSRAIRRKYQQATEEIFKKLKYQYRIVRECEFLIDKDGRKIFIDIAGKQLPYYGKDKREGFVWETFIDAARLDKIEKIAAKNGSEAFIGFCYEISDDRFLTNFASVADLDGCNFGVKLIKTSNFRKYMKPRSASSWDVVDLPRDIVTKITCDPENL